MSVPVTELKKPGVAGITGVQEEELVSPGLVGARGKSVACATVNTGWKPMLH